MPSTYSPDLRIELIGNGQQTGIWGSTTNNNLGTLLEQSIAGITDVSITTANQALIAYNGVEDEARSAVLVISTTTLANFSVYIPPSPKSYIVRNTTLYTATIYASTALGNTTAAGAGVAIPAGVSVLIRTDGVDVFEQLNQIVGTLNVGGTLTAQANATVQGSLTVNDSAFLGRAQTATITVASPAVITVAASPLNGTAVRFTTDGLLPAPLATTTTYYVINRTATTFQVSLTSGGSAVDTNAFGSGTHTVTTVSLTSTAAAGTNNSQIATTQFVTSAVAAGIGNIPVTLTNWSLTETNTSQAATITIATPAVVTVTTAPANGTAIAFTTTGALPTGLTANTPYYVFNRTSTTYNIATTGGQSQTATFVTATPNVFAVPAAPTNGQVVYFTGTPPSGITAGTNYYVVNRTSTTFQISLTSGGSAITFSGTGSCIGTWQSLVATSGSQSGVHTENTSKINFNYKAVNKMSIDLGGNTVAGANVTAFGTP
jgi:hypothetical protein